MPKSTDEVDSKGNFTGRVTGQNEDLVAAEKYNPLLRGNTKSQEQVESSGGLGALAKKLAKPGPSPSPTATSTLPPKLRSSASLNSPLSDDK